MIPMIKVQNPYKELYTTKKPIILLTGGRGGGKSFNAALFCKRLTYQKNHKILFTRYTLSSAEISIIPEFNNKIELEGDGNNFHVTKSEIINKTTDSEIIFRGIKTSSGNQTANLKSIHGLTTFVIDEAEEWDSEDDFDKLTLSIREIAADNRIIIIMNPSDKDHFVYKKYLEGCHKSVMFEGVPVQISTHPDVCHIHSTYHDSLEYLSEKFINEVNELRKKNKPKYNRIILGQWMDIAEGAIFTNWKEGVFDESLPYSYGLDFGFTNDPTALVKTAVDNDKKRIYIKGLCYDIGMSERMIIDMLGRNVSNNDCIVADCAEPRLIDAIYNAGFNIIACEKGPDSVRAGISFMLDYELIVDPDSRDLIRELKNYKWSDKRAGVPVDRYNHQIDGIRYSILKLKQPDFYFG